MTPAGKLEKELRTQVKASGGRIRKLRWIGRVGAPDDFVWWPNPHAGLPPVAAFVEIKAPGDRYSVTQMRECARLRDDGFRVLTLTSVGDIAALVAALAPRQ